MSHLFAPLALRSIEVPNRIGIPPMCQYSAEDGMASDWHFVHYGSRAVGGAGLIIVEATAVVPEGRISPADLGLWNDAQIEPLARLAGFMKRQGSVPAIQLGHAGRKAGVGKGWEAQRALDDAAGGWTPVAPSAVAFGEGYRLPEALDSEGLRDIVRHFAASTRRAREAGFEAVEIHAAHGYLLHQFLSPLANRRTDAYGGNFENRTRLLREVVTAVRAEWPDALPLLIRLSATDWIEGGWSVEETVELCRWLKGNGIDLVDVSSGGMSPAAVIPAGPGFQTGFAARVRAEAGIATAAVGLITSAQQADHIVRSGQADLVLVGREILRQPQWPLTAAQALGVSVNWPAQYLRAAPAGTPMR